MTNNRFEKRIQEKLDQFEIKPSESLLENIFEKRAARSKGVLRYSYMKSGLVLVSVILLTTAIIIFGPFSGGTSGDGASGNGTTVNHTADKGIAANEGATGNAGNVDKSKEARQSENAVNSAASNSKSPEKEHVKHESLALNLDNDASNAPEISNLKAKQDGMKYPDRKTIAKMSGSGKGSKKDQRGEYNDNGNNIYERYFNIDAKDRPMIASVTHRGHSHMMVYHSVNNNKLENTDLNYMFPQPMHTIPLNKDGHEHIALIDGKKFRNQVVKSRKPFFIDVLFTPMITYHQATGNDDLEKNYNSLAESSVNRQFSARVSYPLCDKMSVFAGLGYTQLSTGFNGEITTTQMAERDETITHYINDPILGTISYTTVETIQYEKTDNVKYEFKNTYKIMSLPLGIGYNFGYRNFDFAVNGSALFNLYTNANGSNADFVSQQTEKFESNKKQFGMGGGLGFMVGYKLTGKFKIIAEPNIQYFKINSIASGNVVNEKVLNTGLSIGLRYTVF